MRMAKDIKDIGTTEKKKEKEFNSMPMEISSKENFKMIINKVLEFIFGKMKISTRGNGKTTKKKE